MKKSEIVDLIEKLDDSSLAEIYIKDGEFELSLKKASAIAPPAAAPPAAAAPIAAPAQTGMEPGPAQTTVGADHGAESPEKEIEIITAPIVGTFYRSPSPDSPSYVEEGDEVKTGDTLCIIEAMKVMNELEAEFDCRVKRVLVENQQMVEYGTPLFEIEKL
ncbi:MAG: acetyl-CoA carboxylase biotin carboxyl carrier protein [Spirochaetia bacterium]